MLLALQPNIRPALFRHLTQVPAVLADQRVDRRVLDQDLQLAGRLVLVVLRARLQQEVDQVLRQVDLLLEVRVLDFQHLLLGVRQVDVFLELELFDLENN